MLELLTRLVDKSLVTATPVDAGGRGGALPAAGDAAPVRAGAAAGRRRRRAAHDRHAAHFLARTEALGGRVERAAMRLSAEEFGWFAREHDNLRAALGWLRDRGDAERALRLGAALGRVWFHLGHLSEGRAWLRELLALPGAAAPPAPPGLRAWALDTSASLARRQGDYDAARALHEEALALVRAAGDRPAEVWSLNRLAVLAAVAGDAGTARARVGEMLAAAEALGDPAWRAEGDFVLGLVAVLCHEYPAARAHLEAVLAAWRPAGHRLRSGYVLASLATAALGLGDRAGARAHLAEALGTARAFGDQTLTAWSFELLARGAAAAGQPTRAARLAGAAAALRARMGAPMSTDEAELLERDLARVQRALGPERYRAAQAAGAALTPEEAVAEALAVGEEMTGTAGPDAPPLRPPVPAGVTPSTEGLPRQLTSFVGRDAEVAEVARLLQEAPLVTLTGPGGVGKTRLALEAAGQTAGAWPDGVWLVELAPLAEPGLVPQAVAAALGVREVAGQPLAATLAERLRRRRLLLLLDNCEHVVDAAAPLAEGLLRACPAVHLLATSREPLGVPGETVFRVAPLAAPPVGGAVAAAQLRAYPATRLFLERAALRGGAVARRRRPRRRRGPGLPPAGRAPAGHRAGRRPAGRAGPRGAGRPAGAALPAAGRRQPHGAAPAADAARHAGLEPRPAHRPGAHALRPPGGVRRRVRRSRRRRRSAAPAWTCSTCCPRLVDKSLVVAEPAPRAAPPAARPAGLRPAPAAGPPPAPGRPRERGASATGCWRRCAPTPASAWRRAARRRRSPRGTPTTTWRPRRARPRRCAARSRAAWEPCGRPRAGLAGELDNVRAALRWCLEHGAAERALAFAVGPLWGVWAWAGTTRRGAAG